MTHSVLNTISPIDGRYHEKTQVLQDYFSEKALIYYRLNTEIQYFKALCQIPLLQLKGVKQEQLNQLDKKLEHFSEKDAEQVKKIEATTNHDVKAVEYFLKSWFDELGMGNYKEFVHFGLTSQDINNTAIPLSMQHAFHDVYLPAMEEVLNALDVLVQKWADVPMLARTHGQPASPTRLGKELAVFSVRIKEQLKMMKHIPFAAKFGGATGNFNAHYAAYPVIDWHTFADDFVNDTLGLKRSFPTTQIEHYDYLASFFDNMKRINTIMTDFCRDIWLYISMDYFTQKIKKGEVGSSAMPHKVNPIDFENAEGNLGMSSAIAVHLSEKLPVSRLQRDLTDSTVLRNTGLPFAYTLIAAKSILKGMDKLVLNQDKIMDDLDNNWVVVAEAIQNILRREGYPEPYETLKALTRTGKKINVTTLHNFIDGLDVSDMVKEELKNITPQNYLGR
ncbi:MAG: adenylosuccinate lyase [Candidatus Delongbacteria bacterium]|jgi:adenylosuccinate lyase|nr:adenylosuccinate lyase [Candidatus Delongbacteria bacterium]